MLAHPDGGAFETQVQGPNGLQVARAPKVVHAALPKLYSPPSTSTFLPLPNSTCELKYHGE